MEKKSILRAFARTRAKNEQLPAWKKIWNIFFTICTWPNWPVRAKNLSWFQFEGKTDVWISQVRSVKDMSRIHLTVNQDIWQILNIYRKKRRNCKPSWTSTSCWPARTWPQRKIAQFAKSRKRDGISFTRAEKSKWGFKART